MGFRTSPNQPIHFNIKDTDYCDNPIENCAIYSIDDQYAYAQIELEPCKTFDCCGNANCNQENLEECWEKRDCWTRLEDNLNTGNKYFHYELTEQCLENYNELIWKITLSNQTTNYYALTFTVSNLLSGSLSVWCGGLTGVPVGTINANGTYTFYFPNTTYDYIYFIPSNDFVGDLDNFSLVGYYTPSFSNLGLILGVYDINAPTELPNATCLEVALTENIISVRIDLNCLGVGCYKLQFCDPCQFIEGNQSSYSLLQFTSDNFTIQNSDNATITQGLSTYISWNDINNYGEVKGIGVDSIGLVNDCCRRIVIRYRSNWNMDLTVRFEATGYESCTQGYGLGTTEGAYTTLTINCCIPFTGFAIFVSPYEWFDPQFGPFIEFDSIEFFYAPDCPDYEKTCVRSNCFQVIGQGETNNTELIVGKCNEGTYELGFRWNIYFPELRQRLNKFKYAPTYNIDAKDYIYSDGTRKLTSGQKQKFYDIIFKNCDETQHDVLSTQILCTNFYISGQEYFVDPKDYKPEWDKKTGYQLADVRIQAMKQGTIIFKANQN